MQYNNLTEALIGPEDICIAINTHLGRKVNCKNPVYNKTMIGCISYLFAKFGYMLPRNLCAILEIMPGESIICLKGFIGECKHPDVCKDCASVRQYIDSRLWTYWIDYQHRNLTQILYVQPENLVRYRIAIGGSAFYIMD